MIKTIRRLLRYFQARGGRYSRTIRYIASRRVARLNDEQRDTALIILRLQYLHLFLLCYPRKYNLRTYRLMKLYNDFCRSTCVLHAQVQANLPQEYNLTIMLLIQLTELMALNNNFLLDWYDFDTCHPCHRMHRTFGYMQHPVLFLLAARYRLSLAQIGALVGITSMCRCRR